MSKTLKRLMTTVLTLAMMIGVFAVGGLQVKAAPTYELVAVGDDVTYEGAKALVSDNPSSQVANHHGKGQYCCQNSFHCFSHKFLLFHLLIYIFTVMYL